jgi:hypothetical protein
MCIVVLVVGGDVVWVSSCSVPIFPPLSLLFYLARALVSAARPGLLPYPVLFLRPRLLRVSCCRCRSFSVVLGFYPTPCRPPWVSLVCWSVCGRMGNLLVAWMYANRWGRASCEVSSVEILRAPLPIFCSILSRIGLHLGHTIK